MRWFLLFCLLSGSAEAETIKERLRAIVAHELPEQTKVTLTALKVSTTIPRGAQLVLMGARPPLGLVSFQATWREKDRRRQVFGSVIVSAIAKVAVARAPIRHAEAFNPHNVTYEERELQPLAHTGYWIEGTDLFSRQAQGYIAPGTIIGAASTMLPFAVQPGQLIDLVVERKTLKVTARVKSLESGRIDQWVRVENPVTRKQLLARVTSPGEVRVR